MNVAFGNRAEESWEVALRGLGVGRPDPAYGLAGTSTLRAITLCADSIPAGDGAALCLEKCS